MEFWTSLHMVICSHFCLHWVCFIYYTINPISKEETQPSPTCSDKGKGCRKTQAPKFAAQMGCAPHSPANGLKQVMADDAQRNAHKTSWLPECFGSDLWSLDCFRLAQRDYGNDHAPKETTLRANLKCPVQMQSFNSYQLCQCQFHPFKSFWAKLSTHLQVQRLHGRHHGTVQLLVPKSRYPPIRLFFTGAWIKAPRVPSVQITKKSWAFLSLNHLESVALLWCVRPWVPGLNSLNTLLPTTNCLSPK